MPTKSDADGKFLCQQQSSFETDRSTLDSHCQEIAEYVIPMLATFGQRDMARTSQGEKRTNKLMESTAPLALSRYASAVEGFLTPAGEKYNKLEASDRALQKTKKIKEYFDEANDAVFEARYDPRSGFSSQTNEVMQGVGSMGTCGTFVDRAIHRDQGGFYAGTTYTPVPLVQLYGSDGEANKWDKVHRRYRWSARNICARWKDDVPQEIKKCMEREPEKEFTLLHCVHPNDEYSPGKLGPRGMRYKSIYVWPDRQHVFSRGGFGTMRYAIARAPKGPGEHYGRSPAMLILAEIKTINEMRRSMLRAQHKTLDPPSLIHAENGSNLKLRPGDQNFGMVSPEGKPLAVPFYMGNTFPPTEREMERIRTVINDAFLLTLFQILVERPQQTATETLQRAKEQAILLAPLIRKLQEEYLGSITESEIDIMAEVGGLPPMPPELIEARGQYKIKYSSDLIRALEAGEIAAYQGWLGDVAPVSKMKPEVIEVVDHVGMAREAAEKRGIPSRFIRDEKAMQEINARNQQAQAAAAAMPMMQQAAEVEKAQAEAAAAGRLQ